MKLFFQFIFILAVVASPFYILSSGNPQPADWLMAFSFFLALLSAVIEKRDIGISEVPIPLFLLVFWTVLVSLGWGAVLSDPKSFVYSAFWVFNFLSTYTCFFFLNSVRGAVCKLSWAVTTAIGIAAAGALWDIISGGVGRISGTFNNPNQLAYFSLCALAVVLILKEFKFKFLSASSFAMLGASFSILSASSLAATSALFILIIASILANSAKFSRSAALFVGFFFIALIGAYIDNATDHRVSENILNRIDRASSKMDNVYEERNYSRISDFPQHIFIGASESMHEERFSDDVYFTEIHSSFGSLLFNYGVVGLLLFFSYLYFVLRKVPFYIIIAGMAPLVYSITHMGLRTTIFWFLLIVIYWKYSKRGGTAAT